MSDTEVNKIDTGSIHWKKEEGKLYVTTKENTSDPPGETWIELTTKTKADVVNKLKKQIIGEEGDGEGEGDEDGGDTWSTTTNSGGKKSKKRIKKNKRHTRKNKK